MPTYRAHRLDRRRDFRSGVYMQARNDAEAVSLAEELCGPDTPYVEVVKANRVVDEIECDED